MTQLQTQNESPNVVEVFIEEPAGSAPQTGLFLVFAYDFYYPQGGFKDYLGLALSLDQARSMVAESGVEWGEYQVVNHKNMEVVETQKIGETH